MASKIKLSPPEASAAVRSKAVILMFCLFIVAPIVCGAVIALLCSTLCPSSFAMISLGEKEWVALLLMSFDGIRCY